MCVCVRACRYRCGRDCVWACSAAGREADSPLERARPLRAGGQSGGCPGLRVLDAGRGRPGQSFGQSRHAAFLQDWRSGSWAEAGGALGGRQGPRKQRASRADAPGPCGLREFVRPLSGRFLVPKVGCTSPAWLVERLTRAGLGRSQQIRTLKARPGAQRGGAFSRACTAPTPPPRQARPAAPSSGEASARFLFA